MMLFLNVRFLIWLYTDSSLYNNLLQVSSINKKIT